MLCNVIWGASEQQFLASIWLERMAMSGR